MRTPPIPPEKLNPELRYVHDEISNLITRSQGAVIMINEENALIGPFPPMLHFPQFGIPVLSFIRSLDAHTILPKKVKEVAILTVGAAFSARFELYAHEIMARFHGFSPEAVASLASGNRPDELNEQESIAYEVAHVLMKGRIVPESTYAQATRYLGRNGTAELIFLVGAYALIATVLNGYDMPAPEVKPQANKTTQ